MLQNTPGSRIEGKDSGRTGPYNAIRDAWFKVRRSSETKLSRSLILVLFAAALFAPVLADARDSRPGFAARLQAPGNQDMKKAPSPPMRGDRGKRVEHDKGHKNRLTEQERRELHRDLDRANREIYRR